MKKLICAVLSLMAVRSLSASTESVWIGGSKQVTDKSVFLSEDSWDGLVPAQTRDVVAVFTNSVDIKLTTNDYWYPTRVVVRNNSSVSFYGRTTPANACKDGEFVYDIEAGSTWTEAFMLRNASGAKLVKVGGGTVIGTYWFPHSSTVYPLTEVREGEFRISAARGYYETIRVFGGATLKTSVDNAFTTGSNDPLIILDRGATFDCGGNSETVAALSGEGTVINANPLRLTLSKSGYGFNGRVYGALNVEAHADKTGEQAFMVVSNAMTLAGCDFGITDVEGHETEVRFAPGVGTFYAKRWPTDRTFYDTEGNPVVLDAVRWYVDAENGDDGYAGLDIGSAEHPFKTLAAAMANPSLGAGAHVIAAPGDYNAGVMVDEPGSTVTNRVTVPEGVVLEASGTAAETFITGGRQIRCVHLLNGAEVRGFTLRNAELAEGDHEGGGVAAKNGTELVYGCVITNCTAYYGGAASYARLVRCRVDDCSARQHSVVFHGQAYDSVFGKQRGGSYITCYTVPVVNCTFLPSSSTMPGVHYISAAINVKNCLFLCPAQDSKLYDHCAFSTDCAGAVAISDANLGEGSMRGTTAGFRVKESGALRFASPLVDAGADALHPEEDAGALDYFGKARVSGAAIDIGADELDASVPRIDIEDDKGGLTLTGAGVGETVVGGEPVTVSVSRNYSTPKLCLGFTVNGEFVDFNAHEDGWAWTKTVAAAADSLAIEAVYAEHNEWYVDAENGNDANDGFRPTPVHAKKTLAAAMTNALLAAYDTVWALPGEYTNGVQGTGLTKNRVSVPDHVKLRSTGGADVTFIRGAKAAKEDWITWAVNKEGKVIKPTYSQNYGIGTNSVRAVRLGKDSEVRGFTLADGTCWSDCIGSSKYHTGGNVFVESAAGVMSYIVDCVITNGAAERGGGGSTGSGIGCYVRCRFTGNAAASIGSALNGTCYLCGCVIEKGRNSYVWYNSTATKSVVVNSIITADNNSSGKGIRDAGNGVVLLNSIDLKGPVNGCKYRNCITVGANEGTFDAATVVTNVAAVALNPDLSPVKAADSLALDRGDWGHYWTNWPAAYRDEAWDVNGVPRSLGSAVDIGAAEYDWRKDFAADIARKAAVTDATMGVVETPAYAVSIPDGGAVTLGWKDADKAPSPRQFNFTVADGTLTVSVNGVEAAAFTVDGAWKYENGAATDRIAFSFAADPETSGHAELLKSDSLVGMLLLVR